MNYKVATITLFEKQAKRLAKKYLSLKQDLNQLIDSLIQNPMQGISLANNFYKIRLAITSKNKGKSGGARIITFLKITETTVYLTSIYNKSEKENITEQEIIQILNQIP